MVFSFLHPYRINQYNEYIRIEIYSPKILNTFSNRLNVILNLEYYV